MFVEGGFLQETRESEADIRFQSAILSSLQSFCNRNKSMIGLLMSAILTVSLASLYYLQTMCRWTYAGFPLDDSWIHIEFARSIFQGRPWEYSPGWPSTGSTSPLWAILLSSSFFIAADSTSLIMYTYMLSGILYVASAFLAGLIVYDYTDSDLWANIAIIGFVLTPRGTWLMMSGMESPLFIFLILLGIYFFDKPGWIYDLFIGIIGGFLFLTRPEGVLFLLVGIPLRFLLTAKRRELNLKRLLSFGGALLAAGIIAAPWVVYCLSVTHLPLPDTFYAKSGHITPSSITIWNEFWIKTFIESPFTIIGMFGGFLLVLKGKSCAWVFSIAMLFTYFETIPYAVLVNNARYMTPLISILIIISVIVVGMLADMLRVHPPTHKSELTYSIIATTMILLILIPTTPLFVEQANFFGNSVKNINEMQVTIGQWIFENTPPDAKFAIFDAGAIRFFGNRTVFDLAHLVTPELAHGNFTITETFQWLRDHGCNYTVSWRDWFRSIAIILNLPYTELFSIVLSDNVICAGPDMSVFSLNWNQSTIWSASDLD